MGRIKQIPLKRIGRELIEKYKEEFNTDFENNKQKVQKFSTVGSKSVRNRIAGYITKRVRGEKEAAEREKVTQENQIT